jgi:hypothetical protein
MDHRLAEHRFTLDGLARVLAAAPDVVDLLDRDERWRAPWNAWVPVES